MAFVANPSGVLMPVPTAVPPSASGCSSAAAIMRRWIEPRICAA